MFNKIICKLERIIVGRTKSKDNYIVFESAHHHIFDNSFFLYEYLKQFKKLKLFYVVYNKEQYQEAKKKHIRRKRIIFISNNVNIHILKNARYLLRTKTILRKCSLCFISYRNFYKEYKVKFYADQKMINLRHGQFPFKNVDEYCRGLCFEQANNNMFFRCGTEESLLLLPQSLKSLNCNWFISGMPRNDCLLRNKKEEFLKFLNYFGKKDNYKRIILCMTTFRKNSLSPFIGEQFPIKLSDNDFFKLNNFLIKKDTLLLIKCHHDSILRDDDLNKNMSNIIIFSDIELESFNLYINEIFQYTNALLTDFSSVFFDYLYLDKPIGFIVADIDDYEKTRGFTLDYNLYCCGPKIKEIDHLYNFIDDVFDNNDIYKESRLHKKLFFNGKKQSGFSEEVSLQFINKKYLVK